MNTISWLENWYKNACDGEWEHEYGVRIYTLDNPGWRVEIDLHFTKLETLELEYQLVENSETDWYAFEITGSRFLGASDPDKLNFLLNKFRELVEADHSQARLDGT